MTDRRPAAPRPVVLSADAYIDGVRAGDRAMLARAITLVESTHPDHQALAEAVVLGVLPMTGSSVRIGISGSPGVGKSTFIESFGAHVLEAGHRIAVLAVDPSSPRSGGSILGDKTRMPRLAQDPRAFVRPSSATGTLGGVARRTREALLLCEAAGFDVVVIETVGVGQSETRVAALVDFFVVLLLASAGDELQGIKRGILELADLIAVNKADAEPAAAITRAMADYRQALRIVRGGETGPSPRVVSCSGRTGEGVAEIWRIIREAIDAGRRDGRLQERRSRQLIGWMWSAVEATLTAALHTAPSVVAIKDATEADVTAGRQTPAQAASRLLAAFRRDWR